MVLNELIASSLNPSVIVKVNFHYDKVEEVDSILSAMNIEIASEYIDNCLDIEVTSMSSYLFTNKKYLSKFEQVLNDYNVKYTLTNAVDELFNMTDLNGLLSQLEIKGDLEGKEKAIKIIKSTFESNFSVDDVLDRISSLGSGSLNEFHKNLLK